MNVDAPEWCPVVETNQIDQSKFKLQIESASDDLREENKKLKELISYNFNYTSKVIAENIKLKQCLFSNGVEMTKYKSDNCALQMLLEDIKSKYKNLQISHWQLFGQKCTPEVYVSENEKLQEENNNLKKENDDLNYKVRYINDFKANESRNWMARARAGTKEEVKQILGDLRTTKRDLEKSNKKWCEYVAISNELRQKIVSFKYQDEFFCPITCEIMQDPVITADGHCYERKEIENWLRNHDTSPKTNEKLEHKNLVPNHALKALIDSFIDE